MVDGITLFTLGLSDMKNYNPLYYLLFVLLIMGAFASMAQNDYGQKILGVVAIAFSVLFLIQFASFLLQKEKGDVGDGLEVFCLVVLSAILAMRIFYIRFPYVELVFGGAGLLLVLVYGWKLIRSYRENQPKSKLMALLVLLFHASIIFYIVSMITAAFVPSLSEPAGGAGFGLVIIFIFIGLVRKEIMIEGEKISVFKYVTRFSDRSVVLLALFLIFTAYMGLTKIEVIPKMYSNEFPQVYFKMVNAAETGKEEPMNGKYKHEEFKEKYDGFVNRHSGSDKK